MHLNLLANVPNEMAGNTFRCWIAPGQRVECALSVLDQISSAAWDGFRSFRHGGMEVGGILIGARISHIVHVMDARPLLISHARGAAFLLTDDDYESLDGLIQKTNAQVAPEGFEVIGYYEAHTRREAVLSETDIEIYNTRFHQPSAVCIVLKPNNENGTIVNVYIRDPRGEILQTELEGDSVRYEEAPRPEPAIAPVRPPKLQAQPHVRAMPKRSQRTRRRTYAILLVGIVMGAAVMLITRIRSMISGPPPTLSNTVQQQPAGPPPPASNAIGISESLPTQNPTVSSSDASKRNKGARNRRARSRKQTR
jgi:hypothetical protein